MTIDRSLRDSIRIGTGVSIACQLGSQLTSIFVLAFLYHWVAREDFGLVAVAQLLVMLPRTVVTLGLNAAGIQKDNLTLDQLRGLFWWNVLLGLIASLLTAMAVPVVAYFKEAQGLHGVGYSLSLSALVAGIGIAHQTQLERELRLATLQMIRLGSQLIAGLVAVVCAANGLGLWSLVIQNYLELVLLAVGCWSASPFWPGRPSNARAAIGLLRFGGMYGLISLFFFLASNLDKVLLYALLPHSDSGLAVVGMYQQAFNWMMRPVLAVTTPVTAVMFPALARVQNQPLRFQQLTISFFHLVGSILIPCGVGMWLVADDAMLALGGARWESAGTILRALAPVVIVQGLINICGSVFMSSGQMRSFAFGSACLLIVQVQGFVAGYWLGTRSSHEPIDAAVGLAWGYSLTTLVILAGPYLWFCCRTVGLSLTGLLAPLRSAVLSSLAMGVLVWYVRQGIPASAGPWTRLLVAVPLGMAVYAWLMRRQIREIWQDFGTA